MSGTTTRKPASRTPKPQSTAPQQPAPATTGFLSRKEAAVFTGLNVQIIDAAIKRGELRAYRVRGRDVKDSHGRTLPPSEARRVLIAMPDLMAWATANQV
jgi:hypothetical protein